MSLERSRIKSIIESLIFVSSEPLPFAKIKAVLDGVPAADIKSVLGELQADCLGADRGIYLEEVAMGYQFRSNPENTDWIMTLIESKPRRFSKASLETLAIVAYNQPITRPEIENIRGVDSSSAINLLLERKIVKIVGRKDVPGKPFIFGTTNEFLELFNLKELSALPTLQEIENFEEYEPEVNQSKDDKKDESAQSDENADPETSREVEQIELLPDAEAENVKTDSDSANENETPTDADEKPDASFAENDDDIESDDDTENAAEDFREDPGDDSSENESEGRNDPEDEEENEDA